MGLLDRIAEFGRTLVTINKDVIDFRETLREMRGDVKALSAEMSTLRERLAKVEAFQDATRAEISAKVAEFLAHAERAQAQLDQVSRTSVKHRRNKK